jgi:hypothetical protein
VLENYRRDPRVVFNYAITRRALSQIAPTVRRIRDNGNRVTFNFYSEHHTDTPLGLLPGEDLLEAALTVLANYPDTVIAHPYYVRTLVSGQTDFASFGYAVCPSVSWNHPGHGARRDNGHPTLPLFMYMAPISRRSSSAAHPVSAAAAVTVRPCKPGCS